jgi:hypothetical protein
MSDGTIIGQPSTQEPVVGGAALPHEQLDEASVEGHVPVADFAGESGFEPLVEVDRREDSALAGFDAPPVAYFDEASIAGKFLPAPVPRPHFVRIPNIADSVLFMALMLLGMLVSWGAVGILLHFHWLGLRSINDVQNDTRITIGTELLLYLVGLVVAIPVFRMVWHTRYFAGIHWHGATALRLRYRLVGTALLCNLVAMAGNILLPFPQHAPIDKLFGSAGDAWLLLLFGVTVAPFFEEMIFRGFLLPSVATAVDWGYERMAGRQPRMPDADGNPVWSPAAMIVASLIVSGPFALMHSAQVAQAWGPLLLLYCVSLILCTVRLVTRSLAASTLVHSTYNLMLFGVMLVETSGFRHLDKM